MKSTVKKSSKAKAFSIVELLTVMSIIVILFSLLMPALALARRYAKRVRQHAQFRSISAALELFAKPASEGGYGQLPDSKWQDDAAPPQIYNGAQKLAEALVGQDLLGFNPLSLFRADGMNPSTSLTPEEQVLYPDQFTAPPIPNPPTSQQWYVDNLNSRKGPYLELDGANANTLENIYGQAAIAAANLTTADPNGGIVLCDVYSQVKNKATGKRIGMPILYYRADVSRQMHLWQMPNNNLNIYNYDDNMTLVNLTLPFDTAYNHPIAIAGSTKDGGTADPANFYKEMIRDENVTVIDRPVRADSYILISAGFDGEYGTDDDIFNFTR
ncbi:MAG: pilus assembly FimT family protein [Planctomycetota bacterium]|jgi:type II secretory pathway pseudopilin PulG